MTWAGHEFLDAAREGTRWNQAKELVKKRGSGMMFEVLKTVLVQLATGNVTPTHTRGVPAVSLTVLSYVFKRIRNRSFRTLS